MSKLRISLWAHATPFILSRSSHSQAARSPSPTPASCKLATPSSRADCRAPVSRFFTSSRAMALRSAAAQAATLLRLRSSSGPAASLWVPLARRFSSTQFASAHVEPGLHYAKSHEWVKVDGEIGTIGITAHAQIALGDLVFVELPESGTKVEANEKFGSVESVKAVSDVNSPVSGEVVEFNPAVSEDPSLINNEPYGEGWLIKVKLSDKADLKNLMSPEQYTTYQDEDHH